MASGKEDLYAVLGVDSKASAEDIHKAHKRLMFVYHPDKRKRAPAQTADAKGDVKGDGTDAAALAAAADADADLKFAAISNAYHVLSDPVSRATYDLHSGRAINTPAERRRINRLKRAEADSAVALMEETVDALRAKQQQKNGLVIVEARYGDVSGVPDAEVLTDTTGAAVGSGVAAAGPDADVGSAEGIAAAGRCVDVTVPLQMLVDDEHSSLVIHAGGSKAALSGFYDPMDSDPRVEPRRLWVRYLYLNELHEATVDDRQPLVLPLREHNAGAAGPASASVVAAAAAGSGVPANRTMRARIAQAHALADIKRRRRWVAAGVLGLLFGTAWLYATDRLPALPSWLTPWSAAASDAAKKSANSASAAAAK